SIKFLVMNQLYLLIQRIKFTSRFIEMQVLTIHLQSFWRGYKKSLARKSRTPFLPKLICINVIWEDEEAFPFVRQDKYMAYELLRQQPIMGLDFYKKILEKNSWLETFFPQICNKKSQEVETRRTSIARVLRLIYSNRVLSHMGERMCREISYLLWRYVQFSRRNNTEALSRVRWVTEMQRPYALFGDRI
ncbi:MAG: hypothetical protein WA130_01430, partial [Candidatus Methanoperedens sp.]